MEANSASPTDGEGKSEEEKPESTQTTADDATEALKTQLAEIEVQFMSLFCFRPLCCCTQSDAEKEPFNSLHHIANTCCQKSQHRRLFC